MSENQAREILEAKIDQLVALIDIPHEHARQLLQTSHGDVQEAASAYFDNPTSNPSPALGLPEMIGQLDSLIYPN